MLDRSQKIVGKLKEIFKVRLSLDFDLFEPAMLSEPLLGRKIGLAPRDLIYIFFDIEEQFGIRIPEEKIVDGQFNTFNNIYQIVFNQLKKAENDAG